MAAVKNTAQLKQQVEKVRQAYARWFNGEATDDDRQIVEADLRLFCRADGTAFHPDQRVHAMLEGRREVWLRILQYSTLTTDEIIKIREIGKHRNENSN